MTERWYTCVRPGCEIRFPEDDTKPGPARLTCSNACRQAEYRRRQFEERRSMVEAATIRDMARTCDQLANRYPAEHELLHKAAVAMRRAAGRIYNP